MSGVQSLGYIGIGADDLDAWRTFATDVLGMQAVAGDDADVLHLRMDGRVYRIAVERGAPGALHYLGFEVATPQALAALADDLRLKGVELTEEGDELCGKRRVTAMLSTIDPFGNRVEFFVGHEEATDAFVSPTGATFVTGSMGLGHGLLLIDDMKQFLDFYIDKLGFRLSDTISGMPGMEPLHFLHCNPRHHTLAGASFPGMPSGLQHIMLEVDSIDTVGRAYDKVVRGGIPVEASLGKHTNDHMISFYCKTPSGLSVEYGYNGRLVDDATWVVGHYTAPSYWGHARPEVPA